MKKALCVLLAAMMSASLAACGDKENTGDSGSANSAGKTLRVTWNGDGDNRDKLLSCLEDYQKETGNTVEFTFVAGNWGEYFTKIQTMIAGGESLDCIFAAIEGFQMYVDMGLAMPLTDYAEEHKEEVDELMADVPDGLENTFYIDGVLYGFPQAYNTMVTHYNTKEFDAVGLEYPTEGWTTDDLLSMGEKLTRDVDGVKHYAVYVPTSYFELESMVRNFGGAFMTEDFTQATINSPECVAAFQFYQDLIHKYGYAPIPEPNQSSTQMLIDGTVAMQFAGRWPLFDYKANEFKDVGIQNIPVATEDVMQFGIDGMFVSASTKQYEEACDLAFWMSKPEYMKDFLTEGSIPTRLSVAEETVPTLGYPLNAELFYNRSDTAVPVSSPTSYAECSTIVVDAASQIFVEKADVQTVLDDANEKINQALAG
ncbi:Putative ABC transporter substrate-binding protein yesO [uncultured Ruminococcus sp.]|uniref:Sugar ABC transporter substrate-binding protein n=1 Tax=Massiliimalia timonensis TaxID=1987501 RepID=A0A8J6TV32_9FIRM|nr:sugar ABC transporter substrate-binding protein [Massiliimalia timonensis]MBC8611128.1 sugar ABC transporter substrate-binding protein [Massiliimalia timonensis]SCI15941.1 Putative ABC transporter substrate-binding protein yesO [uncultured Clostridium sp.]SCI39462.1 Putative ABC transporter substrate-binding protein yesO [uncultured Ruminococcus sp.]